MTLCDVFAISRGDRPLVGDLWSYKLNTFEVVILKKNYCLNFIRCYQNIMGYKAIVWERLSIKIILIKFVSEVMDRLLSEINRLEKFYEKKVGNMSKIEQKQQYTHWSCHVHNLTLNLETTCLHTSFPSWKFSILFHLLILCIPKAKSKKIALHDWLSFPFGIPHPYHLAMK